MIKVGLQIKSAFLKKSLHHGGAENTETKNAGVEAFFSVNLMLFSVSTVFL